MTWEAGQRVKFFSHEKMDDVRGTVIKATSETVLIHWDDEDDDCVRVYEVANLVMRNIRPITEEEDR